LAWLGLAWLGLAWLGWAGLGWAWLGLAWLAAPGAPWLLLAPPGGSWRLLAPPGASWCFLAPPGASGRPRAGRLKVKKNVLANIYQAVARVLAVSVPSCVKFCKLVIIAS